MLMKLGCRSSWWKNVLKEQMNACTTEPSSVMASIEEGGREAWPSSTYHFWGCLWNNYPMCSVSLFEPNTLDWKSCLLPALVVLITPQADRWVVQATSSSSNGVFLLKTLYRTQKQVKYNFFHRSTWVWKSWDWPLISGTESVPT